MVRRVFRTYLDVNSGEGEVTEDVQRWSEGVVDGQGDVRWGKILEDKDRKILGGLYTGLSRWKYEFRLLFHFRKRQVPPPICGEIVYTIIKYF